MSRAKKRADRIRSIIPIQRVLADYGYQVDAGYNGEQQFSCDLHGDGMDGKPSARVYPDTASAYCFACDRTRDAIEVVREKEGIDFWAALKVLEARYNLPTLPWDDDDKTEAQQREEAKQQGAETQVAAVLDTSRTFAEDKATLERHLIGLTTDRDLPMRVLLGYWEAFDKITLMAEHDLVQEGPAREGLRKIHELSMAKLRERAA